MDRLTTRASLVALLLAGLSVQSLAASADKTPDDKSYILAKIDPDKDGTLDAKELSTEPGRVLVSLIAY